ncbi:MAG: SHOCT domain-containing protein [Sneathiellales bacterium]|nr:SHOCT domain-containing protein [Sneathiellales bacterium]
MARKKRPGHIEKFLKRADKAIDDAVKEGIRRADEIVEDAAEFGKIASKEAHQKSVELKKIAKIEGERLKAEGERKLNKSISKAKKMTSSQKNDLETLAKLGELRKVGILTEKEFQTKKKKILKRI